MQLIDRDALNKEFRNFVRASNNSDFEPTPNWNDAVSLVGSAPTVDAVKVVRCRDCKHFVSMHRFADGTEMVLCGKHLVSGICHDANFFCADGVRKGQNDE